MKDYRIEVKVKNNKLLKHIKAAKYMSISEFCRKNDLRYATVVKALNFKIPLYGKKGEILSIWLKLSELFRVLPEQLLPEKHHFDPLAKNKSEVEMDFQEIQCLLLPPNNPEELYQIEEAKQRLLAGLDILTPRDKEVVLMAFGLEGNEELTNDEIGKKLNLTRSRINQIKLKSMGMLSRSKYMKCIKKEISTT